MRNIDCKGEVTSSVGADVFGDKGKLLIKVIEGDICQILSAVIGTVDYLYGVSLAAQALAAFL